MGMGALYAQVLNSGDFMRESHKSLIANRRVLAVIAVLLIAAAALVAIFGSQKSKPAPAPKSEIRAPAHVLPAKLPPIRVRHLSSGDAVISLNSDVLFAFDRADLTEKARSELHRQVLPRVLEVLNAPGARVELNGYTDGVGDGAYNQRLSQERANAVRSFLVTEGAPFGRFDAEGFGEKLAASSRPDPDLRRVDVVLHKGESR